MLHIENIDANTFKMYGDIAAVPADIYPKNYEAKAVVVYGEAQPRITISHKEKNDKIAILKKFDEIEIDGVTFVTAESAVIAFNSFVAVAGTGTGAQIASYEVPILEVTGSENTFTMDAGVDTASTYFAAVDGIVINKGTNLTITNVGGFGTAVFGSNPDASAVIFIYYSPL